MFSTFTLKQDMYASFPSLQTNKMHLRLAVDPENEFLITKLHRERQMLFHQINATFLSQMSTSWLARIAVKASGLQENYQSGNPDQGP